ncbi:MAG: hypothetical protein ACK5JM_01700 [Rhodoblastus sp.]
MSGQGAAGQGAQTFKRQCGTCNLCCKLYDTPVVESPAGVWCRHCQPGKGCDIWETRPDQCRAFFCNWIMLDWLGDEWKPDVAKFIFTLDRASGYLQFQVDPQNPEAWKREPYYSQIKTWAIEGLSRARCTLVFVGKAVTLILPDGDEALGELKPEDKIVVEPGRPGTFDVKLQRGAARKPN